MGTINWSDIFWQAFQQDWNLVPGEWKVGVPLAVIAVALYGRLKFGRRRYR